MSEEPLYHHLTYLSFAKPLCPFPTLGPISKKNDCQWPFNMIFINSRPLTINHTIKEVDLRFGKYECPILVKLNRLWQLELLNRKSVYIIEAIPLIATLLLDLLFAPYPYHTIKLAILLGLRTWSIISKIVNKKIKSV